ncbi:hypothetical protein PAERUG_E16_London_17_VIM_2_04_14_06531 [Pseudomonas aeruginosa]|nr:hypothetical protein PAERUG_E16_London_17_VIM_2_04_14_06531 [Pseudomonas aeruginosa]
MEGILDALDGLVGHDRRAAAAAQARQADAVVAGDGLFDQGDAVVAERRAGTLGNAFVPGLVDVHPHAGALAEGALDGDRVGHVGIHLTGADLQLEMPVAAQVEHPLGFLDVAAGVAAGQGPGHLQAVVQAAAEQFADGQAEALAMGVEQGGLDRRAGEGVAPDVSVQALHRGIHVVRRLAQQQRGEMRVEIALDALRALAAVGQATDGGGFAEALDAVAATQAEDHQGLPVHGVHGQLVRADGRQVDDDRLEALDHGLAHSRGSTRVAVGFSTVRRSRLARYRAGFAVVSAKHPSPSSLGSNIISLSNHTLEVSWSFVTCATSRRWPGPSTSPAPPSSCTSPSHR